MSLAGSAKQLLNRLGRRLNFRLESLTAERRELARLARLEQAGHFSRPILPVLPQFERCDPAEILRTIDRCAERLARFAAVPPGGEEFSLQNHYYTTPDAEVLYAIVQNHRPKLVVEVGSGHSTLLFRAAIRDAGTGTKLVSIDPEPRRSVAQQADVNVREPVEHAGALAWFQQLQAGDILFIDSSHELKAGNDVLFLLLRILPTLRPGVLVHVHDIFLPYEYPREWLMVERRDWTEQYLVQALLQESAGFAVLWAGYYLQRNRPDFPSHFPQWRAMDARSLWLRRTTS